MCAFAHQSAGYECESCDATSCGVGTYISGNCSDANSGYKCTSQPTCPDNQYLAGASTSYKGQGTCTLCDNIDCDPGQERVGECNGQTNGFTCVPLPTLPPRTTKPSEVNSSASTSGVCDRKEDPKCQTYVLGRPAPTRAHLVLARTHMHMFHATCTHAHMCTQPPHCIAGATPLSGGLTLPRALAHPRARVCFAGTTKGSA